MQCSAGPPVRGSGVLRRWILNPDVLRGATGSSALGAMDLGSGPRTGVFTARGQRQGPRGGAQEINKHPRRSSLTSTRSGWVRGGRGGNGPRQFQWRYSQLRGSARGRDMRFRKKVNTGEIIRATFQFKRQLITPVVQTYQTKTQLDPTELFCNFIVLKSINS